MAKEDKRRERGKGVRGAWPQRNGKGDAGNGRMAEYSSRTSTPSVAATAESRRSRSRNQKPGIALIQNYLDTAHARGWTCEVPLPRATQFAKSYLSRPIPLSTKSRSER